MRVHQLTFLFALFLPSALDAFCFEPSMYTYPPDAPNSWSKPDVPYCLAAFSYSGRHTCSDWEIDSYVDEVNEYIEELNEFASEAQAFANEAIVFAEEAFSYAYCEAEEVRNQHE